MTSDRLEYLENSFLQVVSQAVAAKVETFAPDLVLALAQAPLRRQVLKRLGRDGVATAMWFVEDFRLFTYWEAFAPYYDLFAVIQKEPLLGKLAAIGQPNGLYLPMAADPKVHRPLELSPVEAKLYGAPVSFMGAGYPNRRLAFRELADFELGIFGSDWDGDAVLAPRVRLSGRRVTTEETVRIFNAAQVNLNLHSSVSAEAPVVPGDFVNPRTFELAMCGAFQLVDRRALLPELFTEEELAQFSSLAELRERLAYFLARPGERAASAARPASVPWPNIPIRLGWRPCCGLPPSACRAGRPGHGAKRPLPGCPKTWPARWGSCSNACHCPPTWPSTISSGPCARGKGNSRPLNLAALSRRMAQAVQPRA